MPPQTSPPVVSLNPDPLLLTLMPPTSPPLELQVRTCLSGCFLAPLLLKVTHQLLIASPVLRRPHLKLRWCLAKATRRWLRMPLCRAMLKGRSRWSMAHLPRRSRVRPTTLPQLSRGMRVVASWRMLIGWPPQVAVPHLRHPMMDGSWITIQAPPPQPPRCPMSADLIGHCFNCLDQNHVMVVCPNPTRYLHCHKEGHNARAYRHP
jgi:hypothetical protein